MCSYQDEYKRHTNVVRHYARLKQRQTRRSDLLFVCMKETLWELVLSHYVVLRLIIQKEEEDIELCSKIITRINRAIIEKWFDGNEARFINSIPFLCL